MDKLREHEDVEPFSEEEAKAEYDEWMKQAIMDDKAQQEDDQWKFIKCFQKLVAQPMQ